MRIIPRKTNASIIKHNSKRNIVTTPTSISGPHASKMSDIEATSIRVQSSESTEVDGCPSSATSCSISDSTDSCVSTLLSRLRQAPLAINNRKGKVARNLPSVRKRFKRPSQSNDPKRVAPEQRMKEFPDQNFVVSAGKLFCTACREEVALKKSIIQLHIKSEKHIRRKRKLVTNEKREQDIAKALGAYDKEEHPVGETLPIDQRIF